MKFEEYLKSAWNKHAAQAEAVASEIQIGVATIESNEQLSQMSQLVAHVFGEHLGRWAAGVEILNGLKTHQKFVAGSETDRNIRRSIATLQIAAGSTQDVVDLSLSEKIRALVNASAALVGKDIQKAKLFLQESLELVRTAELLNNDPTFKAIAMAGNNIACAIEEKPARTLQETELMVLAAQTARKFWEIAGTWLEVERAEYRLAQTYLVSGELAKAMAHAQLCEKIAKDNNAPALELFFASEAIALIEKAKKNTGGFNAALAEMEIQFKNLSADDRGWCESSMVKVKAK